jgi:hypothetical protein
MHAAFALEHAVCVLAAHEKCDGFEARFFRRRFLENARRKSFALGPTQVHSREHLRPIGCIDPARARVDRDDRAVVVVLAIEIRGHFETFDARLRRGNQCVDLRICARFIAEDFDRLARIGKLARDRVDHLALAAEIGELLHDFLRGFGIVPERLVARPVIEFGYRAPLAIVVKDAPEASSDARPDVRFRCGGSRS